MIIWGEDNLLKSFLLEKGDVDAAWADAAHIVEGEYRTGAQEHLYIENNGAIAEYNADTGITVWGSLQCPFYVHKSLMAVFNLPEDKVRVIQTETGGAFGGKEDYPSMICAHAALLAMKSGHPVKIVYDRMEDLAATTKRHPSRIRHRTAVDADGKLLAMDIATGHGRRRLLHAFLDRAFPRYAAFVRPLCVPQRARSLQRVGHEHRTLRGLSRLWRTAGHLRHRAPHGRNRRPPSAWTPSSCGAGTFCTLATPPPPNR